MVVFQWLHVPANMWDGQPSNISHLEMLIPHFGLVYNSLMPLTELGTTENTLFILYVFF